MFKNRQDDFHLFRKKYGQFHYLGHTTHYLDGRLNIEFRFEIPGLASFRPRWLMPFEYDPLVRYPDLSEMLIFHLGMIEAMSYWKLTCAASFHIHGFRLTENAQIWWKKLFYNGLGEFRYLNGIDVSSNDFLHFHFENDARKFPPTTILVQDTDRVLVPIGGGKDSALTLSLLHKLKVKRQPFMINPSKASLLTVESENLTDDAIVFHRSLDPAMLKLNDEGFLNGHTPFSALLAFSSLFAALGSGASSIALSNEASANEDTIPGSGINHQYSKSFEFESDFREYVNLHILEGIKYFSLLRPLSEIAIAGLFSAYEQYHPVFRSCNVGSKEGIWCNKCSKCLFAFLMLGAWMPPEKLFHIFGANLLNDMSLGAVLDELRGAGPEKPFECIGTISEVNLAISEIRRNWPTGYISLLNQPGLIDEGGMAQHTNHDWAMELSMQAPHALSSEQVELIKKELDEILAEKLDR